MASSENDLQEPDAHSMYGECPFGCYTEGEEGRQDCECPGVESGTCDRCRIILQRRPDWKVLRGDHNGPRRIKFEAPQNPPDDDQDEPCTEMIPWLANVDRWRTPCPHSRTGGGYLKGIKRCENSNCEHFDYPPGYPKGGGERMVCEHHIEDSKEFWELEGLYKAHLVGTCRKHFNDLQTKYPRGLNTCTCHNLFDRWQCRRCFERYIHTAQNHFRRRVLANPNGNVDRRMVSRQDYHLQWRHVRRMLAREHPCSNRREGRKEFRNHKFCGRKRLFYNESVMDCRACGGLVIKPSRQRRSGPIAGPLLELDERGQGRQVGGPLSQPGRRLARDPPPGLPSEGSPSYEDDVEPDPSDGGFSERTEEEGTFKEFSGEASENVDSEAE
ncbi:hypothetical protein MMC28_006421 [Mycoblastus sanguinarius]|nr:hypothetical protein [Mycoblastus sanguinarius]